MNINNLNRYKDSFSMCTNMIIDKNLTIYGTKVFNQLIMATNNIPTDSRLVTWDNTYLQVTYEGDNEYLLLIKIDGILTAHFNSNFVRSIENKLKDILDEEQADKKFISTNE